MLRKKEDFRCNKCGKMVVGNGYTDHCSYCLWGRHMDEVTPGDRASSCQGSMKPINGVYVKGKFRIEYKCEKCRHEFIVDAFEDDDRKLLVELMR